MSLYMSSFIVCCVACAVLQVYNRLRRTGISSRLESPDGHSPEKVLERITLEANAQKMHNTYLVVYGLAVFSDWLKGPYVYALYEQYGYNSAQISFLFVCGFISSLVFGTVSAAAADHYGRKKMCVVYSWVYGLSALSKLSPNYAILIFGRVLSGIATSLLFCSFEAWVASEHRSKGYPAHMLSRLFAHSIVINGVAAILAGVLSQAVVTYTSLGFVGPFLLAIPCLFVQAGLVIGTWSENYGTGTVGPIIAMTNGFHAIRRHRSYLYLGASQALYEGAMYVFVFLWTPTVTPRAEGAEKPPYGIIFAAFMVCIMFGGSGFMLLTAGHPMRMTPESLPLYIHGGAMVLLGSVGLVIFFDWLSHVEASSYVTFLMYETLVGLMYPTYSTLRSTHLSDDTRASVLSLFRVPLNVLVIVFLMAGGQLSLGTAFCCLGVIHGLGLVSYTKFLQHIHRRSHTPNTPSTPNTPDDPIHH